jgi:hypothetical protein
MTVDQRATTTSFAPAAAMILAGWPFPESQMAAGERLSVDPDHRRGRPRCLVVDGLKLSRASLPVTFP